MERPEPNPEIFTALFKAVSGREPNEKELNSYVNPTMSEPTEYAAGLKVAVKLAEDRIEIANMLHSGDKNDPIYKAFLAGIEDVLVSLRGSAARSAKGEDYRLLFKSESYVDRT